MRWLICWLMLCPLAVWAQTRAVDPDDLVLRVTVENAQVTRYQQEMILLTIHGIYRRHITLEKLEQPDLSGFNWMQLGHDHWYESQLDGKTVKNFKRRMALYPDQIGELTVGPFVHHLTLTDEGDDWFAHEIRSAPLTLRVMPAPQNDGWWFPVRRLEVSDQWSNAPDQLKEGEGVLRVIRITAVGVAPDMIPPMPALTSPSAMIFAHPEKRLVELSPQGPVSVAFWRWTIRPTNGASAILEPMRFDYFDTTTRKSHNVTITAQRVAMDESLRASPARIQPTETRIRPVAIIGAGLFACLAGLVALLVGRRLHRHATTGKLRIFNPSRRALRRAARAQNLSELRRAATDILRDEGSDPARLQLLRELDSALFGRAAPESLPDLRRFAKCFLAARSI